MAPISFSSESKPSSSQEGDQGLQDAQQQQQQQNEAPLFEGNHVELVEKMSCSFSRDGEPLSFDLKGDLSITISAEDAASSPQLQFSVDEEGVVEKELAFQSNPKIHKDGLYFYYYYYYYYY